MSETPTRALVFDAYGTLFDVTTVRYACAAVAADPAQFAALWRAKQLEYAFLRALMQRYADFWSVTRDALRYAAAATETHLEPDQEDALMEAWLHVRAFADAEPALRALAARGLSLAILSNGTPTMLNRLADATGLAGYFSAVLSVEAVQSYKPTPAVYALIERQLGVRPEETLFVSSNFWDIAGARAYGLRACWINRDGAEPEQLGQQPNHVLDNLTSLAGLVE